jgi:hypothetical protein
MLDRLIEAALTAIWPTRITFPNGMVPYRRGDTFITKDLSGRETRCTTRWTRRNTVWVTEEKK